MMHAFMQLNDGTEIVHSDILYDENGQEYVKVYMEKPIMQGFKSAYCILPQYDWKEIEGFDELELMQLKDIIKSTAHLIIRFARQEDWVMPQIFRIAGYLIYFWSNENKPLEPVHVHISTLRYRLRSSVVICVSAEFN